MLAVVPLWPKKQQGTTISDALVLRVASNPPEISQAKARQLPRIYLGFGRAQRGRVKATINIGNFPGDATSQITAQERGGVAYFFNSDVTL